MVRSGVYRLTPILAAAVLLIGIYILIGCDIGTIVGSDIPLGVETSSIPEDSKPVTLTFMLFSADAYQAYRELDLVGIVKKAYPHITVELEMAKDSEEFEKLLRIRKAADELPDIMPMKPYMLAAYRDALAPLNETDAARKSLHAHEFAIDGEILGIPESTFNEFVWYRKSVFKEYGLEVPQTWDEFIEVCRVIRDGGKYIPLLMGGKDAWPTYPFNEFMPILEAGDGHLWNIMAAIDEPFAQELPFYRAYGKIQRLYDLKPFGPDPLGSGFDQAKVLFGTKGAMIAAGGWFVTDARQLVADTSDIGTFFLPVREEKDQVFNTITMVDGFFSTPREGRNLEASKMVINTLFDDDFYRSYLMYRGLESTVQGITVERDALIQQAYDLAPNAHFITYNGGNVEFQRLVSAVKFDVKRLGQEMIAGKDLDKKMEYLNGAWKAARNNRLIEEAMD